MKHTKDGTFVPKHVAVSNLHEVGFIIPVLLHFTQYNLSVEIMNVRRYMA